MTAPRYSSPRRHGPSSAARYSRCSRAGRASSSYPVFTRASRSWSGAESCSMIDQFVGFCLQRRISVIVIALLLAVFGIYAWETLSVEAYPELGDVAAQVTTQVPGL